LYNPELMKASEVIVLMRVLKSAETVREWRLLREEPPQLK
jgi:hypothetical protein